jgi:hypothetical protein
MNGFIMIMMFLTGLYGALLVAHAIRIYALEKKVSSINEFLLSTDICQCCKDALRDAPRVAGEDVPAWLRSPGHSRKQP